MRQIKRWALGLAHVARHVIGCHYIDELGLKMRWMTWPALCLADIAHHVLGCPLN
jgi:hypothetical protein